MSTDTNTTPETKIPADSVCVLCATGTTNILGGQKFQTYSPDGAKKAATKLENEHKDFNKALAVVLAKSEAERTDEDKAFLKEKGSVPLPESLEIRILESINFSKLIVPRSVQAPKAPLTAAQKEEKIAQTKARLEALLAAETVG